jgi:hypothetical protein
MSSSALIRVAIISAAAAVAACTSTPASVDQARIAADLDSIVLERGPCFGFCPTYRLVIDGSGRIRYRNVGEDQVRTDSIAPDAVKRLAERAVEAGFYALPERIMGDSTLCSMVATDHPGVIVSFFGGNSSRTVDHYTGCNIEGRESPGPAPAIVRLISLENAIDSTANVERWRRQPGARQAP